MATPRIAAAANAGLGTQLTAYGYAMSGTAATACTAPTIVTTIFHVTTPAVAFKAGRYQTVTGTYTSSPGGSAITVNLESYIMEYGVNSVQSVTGTIVIIDTLGSPASNDGAAVTSDQLFWWDFAQTNVYTGQTQFGRGGGDSNTPCGYYVTYAYEAPAPGNGDGNPIALAANALPATGTATVDMWTDGAMTNTIGAFLLASIAAFFY